jgi:hypothetical protein
LNCQEEKQMKTKGYFVSKSRESRSSTPAACVRARVSFRLNQKKCLRADTIQDIDINYESYDPQKVLGLEKALNLIVLDQHGRAEFGGEI